MALVCKAPPGENAVLVESDPARFFMPSYVGPRGWIGLRLDTEAVDWDEVAELVLDGYRLVAPKWLTRSHVDKQP
ncbi:MAG: MmcQ/YjbR family DNA-binding protein [Thermoleophilaceae bacterium]